MPLLPVALYGLEVPAGDIITPAVPDFPATFRITMAAIDPSAPASIDGVVPRATLKLVRQPIGYGGDDDSEEDSDDESYMRALLAGSDSDSDEEEEEEEEEEEDDEVNGGPSDPAKSKKARKEAALKELLAAVNEESDDEMEDVPNGVNGTKNSDKKGKAKATDEDEEEDDDEDDDSEEDDEEDFEIEEFVICTLDPEKIYQQALDITVGENERVFFKVSGTHAIHLTGNYVIPDDDGHNHHRNVYDSDEEEQEYDLSPDDDELDVELEDDESDELDNLEDPRITELESEEEVPKLIKAAEKGKNKRVAEDEPELEPKITLDDLMAKSLRPEEATTNGEAKLSKKQLKKLKNNKGEAVTTKAEEIKKEEVVKESPSLKGDKKVQFAKDLEQGPTGSTPDLNKTAPKTEKPEKTGKAELGVKVVQGVTIDDKKLGTGPAAKKGDKVGMRYIGKLKDGKVFDANKKGKPFTFKLGAGEVISGWDIGVAGMTVGGERRLTIPAALAYGNKAQPGIPAKSTLIFDLKLLEIK